MGHKQTGLEMLLVELLNKNADDIERHQSTLDGLRQKARFCHEHKLEEEKRITQVKQEAMEMLLFDYKSMFNELKSALDNWNS